MKDEKYKKLKNKDKFNILTDFRLVIDESYDEIVGLDKLIYHTSDKLIDGCLFFDSISNIDFNKKRHEDLYFFADALFMEVPELIYVSIENYKISFYKSPVFYWNELEEKIFPIFKREIIKERNIYLLGRNRVHLLFNKDNDVSYIRQKII